MLLLEAVQVVAGAVLSGQSCTALMTPVLSVSGSFFHERNIDQSCGCVETAPFKLVIP
jgi:hypothetical protein